MAAVFDEKCMFLLCILTHISRYQAQNCLSSNLANTVVYEGSSASFKRVNNNQSVQWSVNSASDFFNLLKPITNYDDVVVSQFSTTYAVTQSELTIFNSTVAPQGSSPYSTAGLYTIRYLNPNCTYGANLIVIRSGPYCSSNASDPNNVKLSCGVDFAESPVHANYPVFTWKNSTTVVKQQQQPVPSQVGQYLKRSTSQLAISGNDATRYECQLTFTPNSPWNNVTSTAPNFTASCFSSMGDVFVVPSYGPAAGATVLTIVAQWTALPISISAVYIGENLTAYINRTSMEKVIATTPEIENELTINQQLPVTLEISPNSANITTGKYFTYKPNPEINDISPKELILSGGIHLTVTGTSLDSVAQPLLRAVVVIRRGRVITYNNQSFSPCFQPTQDGAQMICLSPPIYIRDDFLQQLFGQTNPYSNSRRKREAIFSNGWIREDKTVLHDAPLLSIRSKRSTSISTNQTYTLQNSEDKMQIYVGIVLDGFKKYESDILLDSGERFSLRYPPTLKCDGNIEFDYNTITIPGSNLSQCYRPSDYTVRIGDGNCKVKDLTDNALTCSPPEKKPQQTEHDIKYDCGKDFAVIVELGYKVYSCSCLKYPNNNPTKLIIIIVTTVGSFVVVLVIISVIVVVVRKSQKAKKQTSNLRTDNSYVIYRRKMDTIYVSSTPGGPYLTQLPDSSSELANHMFREHGDYLSPFEEHYQNADETGCYETTIA